MRRGAAFFVSFSAAVFAAVYLLPASLWLWLGLAALPPAAWCLWKRRGLGAVAALGVCAALLWCTAYRLAVFAPGEALDARRTQVTVCATERAAENDYGCVLPCYILGEGLPVSAAVYGDEALREVGPGDTLTFLADCTCRTWLAQGEVSSQASNGVFVTLRVRGGIRRTAAEGLPWWALPRHWGQALAEHIRAAFPDDVAPLFAAMAAGERSGLPENDQTALTRSGIAHLLAVSGMHVGFLVGLLTLFTGADPRRRAAVCLPVLALFALAVGGRASVLRACLIWAFALLAPVLGRERDTWTALAAALALLLLWNPLSAANVGLQLSFAAVAGITLVTGRISEGLSRLRFALPKDAPWWRTLPLRGCNRLLGLLRGVLASTLGALLFTVPLSAYYFGTLSLAAPLTNLLTLPVAAVVFVAGLVTGLVGFLSPAAAGTLGGLFAWSGRYLLAVARAVGGWSHSAVTLRGGYYPGFLLCAYGLILMAVLWRGERRRWWVFASCGGVMLAAAVLFTRLTFRVGELSVTVLNVGQGQSVLLTSAGETALVDCGGNRADNAGDIAADFLLDGGRTRLDKLILTHFHDDHTNGLAALFDRLDVGEVILPQMEEDLDRQSWALALAAEEGAAVTWVVRDRAVTLGGAELQLFAPMGSGEANEAGLSLLATAGDFDVLITGDMGATVEKRLVRYHQLPRCEVLVAGHHGAADSSCETLLEAIRPQSALISVGHNNYGHPAEETLARLADAGADIYRTDLSGAVTVTARPGRQGG